MTATSPRAFALSASLHAAVVLLLVMAGWMSRSRTSEAPTILELVAGEGDNYMATEAPALGDPNSIKLEIPEPAVSQAPSNPVQAAPEPVVEPAPPTVTKAPAPVTKATEATVTKAPEAIPDLNKMLKNKAAITQIRKEANDRLAQKRAEKKAREEAAKQAKEEAAKTRRMTKADFDKLNKTSNSSAKTKTGGSVKVQKIDTKGIVNGVLGGSTANTTGGAGGTALTRAEADAVDLYTALLARRIKEQLDERPGVGAGLVVEVEIRIQPDGSIRGFRIVDSSGSRDFDDAVRETFAKLKMPPRPKGLSELQRFPIRGVE